MEKIGLEITKQNIKEYVGKNILAIQKQEQPKEKKRGFKLSMSFSWDKRQDWMNGYSGYSGYSRGKGFRCGNLESLDEIRFLEVSPSGECVLVRDYQWNWQDSKERFQETWYTVDSIIDVYYFIEAIE